jgi:hypothetical protein
MRLKIIEDVCWVEKTTTIMMDVDAYFAHIKVGLVHLLFLFIHLVISLQMPNN